MPVDNQVTKPVLLTELAMQVTKPARVHVSAERVCGARSADVRICQSNTMGTVFPQSVCALPSTHLRY